ncbi:MAG: imidazoleglycerol-phosphate dehydratase HisB [Anaerolineales bacterium]
MRKASMERKTRETQIQMTVNLDGHGKFHGSTGIGFLDHMLEVFAHHGMFDIELDMVGDLKVDAHHTTEDCALVLGQAVDQALGDRAGIERMGYAFVPMDEALARVVVDLSGRPYSVIETQWTAPTIGILPTTLLDHFFESLAVALRANLHIALLYGRDDHHKAEAIFKALGRSLRQAVRIDPERGAAIPSSKGVL